MLAADVLQWAGAKYVVPLGLEPKTRVVTHLNDRIVVMDKCQEKKGR